MKKEELIEELKKEIEATKNVLNCEEHFNLYAKGKRVGLEFGWMFAEKLDEPELPAIPQFVADHIELRKKVGKRLNVALSESPELSMSEKMNISIFEANNIYARAWLDGYTIEREPLYYMKLKEDLAEQMLLTRHKYLNVSIGKRGQAYTFDDKMGYSSYFKTKLTKEEVEIWKNKLNELEFDIVEVTE